jgi:RNA polymerase sigma-70 factor, ECF subfamily
VNLFARRGVETGKGPSQVPVVDRDSDLLKRVAAGDGLALRALHGRHGVRVFRFILRMVANEAIAEELTNEVFLQAWRHADGYRGNAEVSTWLLSIARNRAIGALRKRSDAPLEDGVAEALKDEADPPDVELAKQDKAALMRRCVETLPPAHREIVDLVYYQELSVAEAADLLSIPENTVKTRMFHARKKLSAAFREAGIDRGWP